MRSIYQANQVNIHEILFLKNEEVKKQKTYRWMKHPSVSIKGHLWYRHSTKKHGMAVEFLVYFFGYTVEDAVDYLYDNFDIKEGENNHSTLRIPKRNNTNKNVRSYLIYNRFIDEEIVDWFIEHGYIYEDRKYGNCHFVGFDENQNIKHINIRSINDLQNYMKYNSFGSQSKYSFHYIGTSNIMYVFEAPIDMLSYITLHKENWESHSYVSLCGVGVHALNHMLSNQTYVKIILCLDNDYAGQKAVGEMIDLYHEFYEIEVRYPRFKDYNEDLKSKHHQPVKGGYIQPFEILFEEDKAIILSKSKGEKDKNLKDLFDPVSLFKGNIDSKSNVWKARAIASLIDVAKNSLFLARQQYRHLEESKTIESLLKDIKLDECYMKYCDDHKFSHMTELLEKIKRFVYIEIQNKQTKYELIETYMELAKLCLHTHVFLVLEEEHE